MDEERFRRAWSALHGGVAPSGAVGGWLRVSYALAAPLARRGVPPSVVTLTALAVALVAPVPASAAGAWPVLAAALVAGSGVLDGLDGTVAVLQDRASRWGFVLDSLCDRVSEAGFAAALWAAGAPGPVAAGWVAVAWLQEYLRARAAVAGMDGIGVVTVAERPTRIAVAAMFLLGAGLYPPAAGPWVGVGAAVGLVAGLVGLVQLLVVVHRSLAGGGPDPAAGDSAGDSSGDNAGD